MHRELRKKVLQSAREEFRPFFNHVISGAFQSQPDGKLLLVNDAFVKLLKYQSKKELMEINARDFYVNSKDRNKWKKQFAEQGEVRNAELLLKRKDGQVITVLENARAVRSISGKILYYEGTLTDISKRKRVQEQLRDSEAKFRSFFDNVISGAYRTAPDGKILLVNKSMVRMLGYRSKADLMSINAQKLYVNRQYRKKWISKLNKDGKFYDAETVLKRKDGQHLIVLENARTVYDQKGKVLYYEGTITDITERKRVDQAKTEFVYLASHQLRTPISAINWYSETLLAGRRGKLTSKQKVYVDKIYQSNQRMINLINDFLNVSQIELGTVLVKKEKVDVVKKTRTLLDELKSQYQDKHLKIEEVYETVPIIESDSDLVQIVLQNLMSNAMKYTPPDGRVRIKIKKQQQGISIIISDTGLGIPAKQQGRVFTKFFRGDNIKESDPGGTGLGLYIVKSIIEQIRGKIRFKSIENKGTTFYVRLPYR